MKIKIYSLAVDSPKCATHGSAHLTEAEAYKELLRQLGEGEASDAHALLAAGKMGGLVDWLEDSNDGLTTWTIDENEIEFPGIMPTPLNPGGDLGEISTGEIKNVMVPRELWDDLAASFGLAENGNSWMYCDEFYNHDWSDESEAFAQWARRIITALGDFDGDLCFFKE
jgi:hypothetical protein